jgi:methionyl-tRNA formyltransferase
MPATGSRSPDLADDHKRCAPPLFWRCSRYRCLAMRIVLMGTSGFAVPTMLEIVRTGTRWLPSTRAPAASGCRGLELKKTPVHVAADSIGVPVFTPSALRTAEAVGISNAHAADVAIVAAFGLLLPISILQAPRLGCINLHGSLLPRWRGAAPIQLAIMAGEKLTGVDIIRMNAGLDTGPIAMREITPIRPDETAGDLTSRLSATAAKLAINTLRSLEADTLKSSEQPPRASLTRTKSKKVKLILIGHRAQKLFATKFTDCRPGRELSPKPASVAATSTSNFSARRLRQEQACPVRS